MAGDTKGERWVWTVLGAISLGLVAAAGYLYQAHQPVWSFRLFIVGLFGLAILILRLLWEFISPLHAVPSKAYRYALGTLRWIGRAIAGVYVAAGVILLGPFVRQIIRSERGTTWTAGLHNFGESGNYDYKVYAFEGQRVAHAQFRLFPESISDVWIAGFALSFSPFNFDPTTEEQKVLCEIESDSKSEDINCRGEGRNWKHDVPQAVRRKGGYLFDIESFQLKSPSTLGFRVRLGGVFIDTVTVPRDYARNLTFFVWAEEGGFRVDFTQIHISWVPE